MYKKIICIIILGFLFLNIFNINYINKKNMFKKDLNRKSRIQEIVFYKYKHCGNTICEINLGGNYLNCPQDCFFSKK